MDKRQLWLYLLLSDPKQQQQNSAFPTSKQAEQNSCFSLCKRGLTPLFHRLCPKSHSFLSGRAKSPWFTDSNVCSCAFCAKQKVWNKATKALAAGCRQLLGKALGVEQRWRTAPAVQAGVRWVGTTFRPCRLEVSSALPRALGGWSWCLEWHLLPWLIRNGSLTSWECQWCHTIMSSMRKDGQEAATLARPICSFGILRQKWAIIAHCLRSYS